MRSLLVVHQGAVGDFILSLPAVEALHRGFPRATFTFLANPNNLQIIQGRPYVGEILDCRASGWSLLYRETPHVGTAASASLPPVETAFVFGRPSSQILVDNLAKILGSPAHRLDPFPEPELGLSVSEYQCKQLQKLDINALPPPPAIIAPAAEDLRLAREFVRENLGGSPLVLIHPGSGSLKKVWSPRGWLEFIHKLGTVFPDLQPGLIQGPADDHVFQQLLPYLSKSRFLLIRNWGLGRLAALTSLARLYAGNDSGITHLAAASGVPTIALFGPTEPRIWGPMGPRVKLIRWRQDHGPEEKARDETKALRQDPAPELGELWRLARQWLESAENT